MIKLTSNTRKGIGIALLGLALTVFILLAKGNDQQFAPELALYTSLFIGVYFLGLSITSDSLITQNDNAELLNEIKQIKNRLDSPIILPQNIIPVSDERKPEKRDAITNTHEPNVHLFLIGTMSFLLIIIVGLFLYSFLGFFSVIVGILIVGCVLVLGYFQKVPSHDEIKKFWTRYDVTRLELGVIFIEVSIVSSGVYQLFSAIPSSDVIAFSLAFYILGVTLFIDGLWTQKEDFESIKTQQNVFSVSINGILNRQTEIRNELDTLSKKIETIDQKITQKTICSKVRFKYRYPITRHKPDRK